MSARDVVQILKRNRAELEAAGIAHLDLFGSTARDQTRSTSDIDLLVTFRRDREISLLDIVHLENRLSDLCGRTVDLIEPGTLRLEVGHQVEADLVRAF